MEIIGNFGPKVAKYKLTNQETDSLFKICVPKKQEDYSNSLVGFISEEINIFDDLKKLDVFKTINNNMEDYLQNVDSGFWTDVVKSNELNNYLQCTESWYNKQVKHEYNPIHNHILSADLVCVIFPKIKLDPDVKYYNTNAKDKQVGQLNFNYGESEQNGFGMHSLTVNPEEGDMYVFPSTLRHFTYPVLGESERYSISCNYKFTSLARRLFKNLGFSYK